MSLGRTGGMYAALHEGAAHPDQTWHIGWLAITAAIIAGRTDH